MIPIVPSFAEVKVHDGLIEGEVVYIDDFGNLLTNIAQSNLASVGISEGDTLLVKVRDKSFRLKICEAYGCVSKNELLTIIGSSGFLEISVNQGSALRLLGVDAGGKIIIVKETNHS